MYTCKDKLYFNKSFVVNKIIYKCSSDSCHVNIDNCQNTVSELFFLCINLHRRSLSDIGIKRTSSVNIYMYLLIEIVKTEHFSYFLFH